LGGENAAKRVILGGLNAHWGGREVWGGGGAHQSLRMKGDPSNVRKKAWKLLGNETSLGWFDRGLGVVVDSKDVGTWGHPSVVYTQASGNGVGMRGGCGGCCQGVLDRSTKMESWVGGCKAFDKGKERGLSRLRKFG